MGVTCILYTHDLLYCGRTIFIRITINDRPLYALQQCFGLQMPYFRMLCPAGDGQYTAAASFTLPSRVIIYLFQTLRPNWSFRRWETLTFVVARLELCLRSPLVTYRPMRSIEQKMGNFSNVAIKTNSVGLCNKVNVSRSQCGLCNERRPFDIPQPPSRPPWASETWSRYETATTWQSVCIHPTRRRRRRNVGEKWQPMRYREVARPGHAATAHGWGGVGCELQAALICCSEWVDSPSGSLYTYTRNGQRRVIIHRRIQDFVRGGQGPLGPRGGGGQGPLPPPWIRAWLFGGAIICGEGGGQGPLAPPPWIRACYNGHWPCPDPRSWTFPGNSLI